MNEPNILIKEALHRVVNGINEGSTPTAALEKSARELDLNPNFIKRAAEATNVALHYTHFKSAEDKSVDFAIADSKSVIDNIFNETEKTAAQARSR